MDDVTAAKIMIRCLDLTSLNNDDTDAKIKALCNKAIANGVAAVCVYPKFIVLAKELLENTGIKVATVVNFPKGETDLEKVRKEIRDAIKFGADEIDAVLPYKNPEIWEEFLSLCRKETENFILKIIIESGELKKPSLIENASKMCIKHNVDFIKTSTGKSPVSATPEAANVILETIAKSKSSIGFKVSGGVKTMDEAKKYFNLCENIMNLKWVNPKNFRIGASSLLDSLLETIEKGY